MRRAEHRARAPSELRSEKFLCMATQDADSTFRDVSP